MKRFFQMALVCAGLVFLGCSEESSNADYEESGYFIVSIGSYELTGTALLFDKGQCEVHDGKLVWSKNGELSRIPASLDESEGYLGLSFSDYSAQYKYIGNSFPVGMFRSSEALAGKIDGVILENDKTVKFVMSKKTNCFFDDYGYSVPADAKRIDCNTFEQSGMLWKFKPFEGTSMKSVLSVGKVSCDVEYKIRYPYNEQDCRDAYSDFLKDSSASSTFNFKNYSSQKILDEECLKDLKIELVAKKIREE